MIFLSLHYTLEMQTKWYYLVQFSKKSMRKFVLIKKLRSKGQKKGHKAKILACSSVLNFFSLSIYASHTTFPSNFGVSIGAFWYFFQNWPKSLHKIGFFTTLRLFFSSFKAAIAGNMIISLVYTIFWAKLANKVNFDPKILAALAQSNVQNVKKNYSHFTRMVKRW